MTPEERQELNMARLDEANQATIAMTPAMALLTNQLASLKEMYRSNTG